MNTIPKDVMIDMLLPMHHQDILNFCTTNKEYNNICDDTKFWYRKYVLDFGKEDIPIVVNYAQYLLKFHTEQLKPALKDLYIHKNEIVGDPHTDGIILRNSTFNLFFSRVVECINKEMRSMISKAEDLDYFLSDKETVSVDNNRYLIVLETPVRQNVLQDLISQEFGVRHENITFNAIGDEIVYPDINKIFVYDGYKFVRYNFIS